MLAAQTKTKCARAISSLIADGYEDFKDVSANSWAGFAAKEEEETFPRDVVWVNPQVTQAKADKGFRAKALVRTQMPAQVNGRLLAPKSRSGIFYCVDFQRGECKADVVALDANQRVDECTNGLHQCAALLRTAEFAT